MNFCVGVSFSGSPALAPTLFFCVNAGRFDEPDGIVRDDRVELPATLVSVLHVVDLPHDGKNLHATRWPFSAEHRFHVGFDVGTVVWSASCSRRNQRRAIAGSFSRRTRLSTWL